jgi:arylformamidase
MKIPLMSLSRTLLKPLAYTAREAHTQLNNRDRVPEFAQHFERWQRESAAARSRVPAKLNLAYGSHPLATLDVFEGAGNAVLFFIHGGYWRALDKSDHSFIAEPFLPHASVVVPNYPLCPGTAQSPVDIALISRHIVAALEWAQARFGTRVVVAGHSAGGHLAAMLAARGLSEPAFAISGLFELSTLRQAEFLQADLRLTEAVATACSPAWMPAPARGELHCSVGELESEEFKRQNRLMQLAWGAERVPTVCEEVGRNHFTVLDALTEPQAALHQAVKAALG